MHDPYTTVILTPEYKQQNEISQFYNRKTWRDVFCQIHSLFLLHTSANQLYREASIENYQFPILERLSVNGVSLEIFLILILNIYNLNSLIQNFQSMKGPLSDFVIHEMSYLWFCYLWNVNEMSIYEMDNLWNVLSLKCPSRNGQSIKCQSMKCSSIKCPSMKCLSIKCPSIKWQIYIMSSSL